MAENGALVPASGELVPLEVVEARLAELIETGNAGTLHEVAQTAAAHQEYERRQQAQARANYFGRLKVMSEAAIGVIDIEAHPLPRDGDLVLGEQVIEGVTRGNWRLLGVAAQIDRLSPAFEVVERGDREQITTHSVVVELRQAGVMYVSTAPLNKRYRELFKRDGLTVSAVAKASGVKDARDFLTRPKTKPRKTRCTRPKGVRLAEALGIDPQTLEGVRVRHRAAPRRRRLPLQRKLTGGRLDETYSLIRRALQELDATAGATGRWGTGEAYDHLYEAERIVGAALKRAT